MMKIHTKISSSVTAFAVVLLVALQALLSPVTMLVAYSNNPASVPVSVPISEPVVIPPTPSTNQSFGKAIKFNNENSNSAYAVVKPAFLPANAFSGFTLEGWVKTPKPVSGKNIRDYSIATYTKDQAFIDNGYLFRLGLETQESNGSSRPYFQALISNWTDAQNRHLAYASVNADSGVTMQSDKWYHLAVTASSSGNNCYLNLYVNGQLAGSANRSYQDCQFSTQSPQEILIAKPASSLGGLSGHYYPGSIDEVRFSMGVRYNQNFSPEKKPFGLDGSTVALYHFDGSTTDSSLYKHMSLTSGSLQYENSALAVLQCSLADLIKTFGKQSKDKGFNELCDMNHDERISILDYSLYLKFQREVSLIGNTPVKQPELVVVSASPVKQLKTGAPALINVTIKNTGDADAALKNDVFYLSSLIVRNSDNKTIPTSNFAQIQSLKAGEAKTITISTLENITQPGKYTISGEIDILKQITEKDENNNKYSSTFEVIEDLKLNTVSPNSGNYGDNINLSGSGFGSRQGSVVFYNSWGWVVAGAPIKKWSNNEITMTVPYVAKNQNYQIEVRTADWKKSNKVNFYVKAGQPTISWMWPYTLKPNNWLLMVGENLGYGRGEVVFYQYGTNKVVAKAAIYYWSDWYVYAWTPASLKPNQSYGMKIKTADGRGSSVRYVYVGR